jgi:hypothetical protein
LRLGCGQRPAARLARAVGNKRRSETGPAAGAAAAVTAGPAVNTAVPGVFRVGGRNAATASPHSQKCKVD